MLITTDILYDILKENLSIQRYGCRMEQQILSLPVFYEETTHLEENRVYILRTRDMPLSPETRCLYICVGQRPYHIREYYPGEIFFISEQGIDLLTVFNHVQKVFDRLITWETQMKSLQNENADIKEMVRLSIPIFENKIIVTDYNLQIVAYCEAADCMGHRAVNMCDDYEMVPKSHSILFQNDYITSTASQKPYMAEIAGDKFYCINLYLEDVYMGVCSLSPDFRKFRDSDFVLFQIFADFVCNAFAAQSKAPNSRFVTMKTIFTQLLQCLPVSRQSVDKAMNSLQRNFHHTDVQNCRWTAIVIRSANKQKTLPEEYLCSSIEGILNDSIVIRFDNSLVAFCMSVTGTDSKKELYDNLTPFLQDMNFRAGISEPFSNLFDARTYYAQARSALEIGTEQSSETLIYPFSDYAFLYMLKNCCGEFEPEQMIPESLLTLIHHKGNTDYADTLKHYLDNEMNASRTAQDMFLHRSSLMPRLEKIKSMVDLSTPQQRLYIRMCLYLYEYLCIHPDKC